jgi:pimeloyl-ACP methyl ester carboxylesterase
MSTIETTGSAPISGGAVEGFADVNGVRLRYLRAGEGSPWFCIYAQAYAQPGGMRAGFEYFRSFERDAGDFARLAGNRLAMPVLILTGEKGSGTFLIEQGKQVAIDVHGRVVMGAGHWLMEEAPNEVIPAIIDFVNRDRKQGGAA